MKKKIKKEYTNFRFNVLTVLVYIIGIILIVKLFELQIVKGVEYREISNTRLSRESVLEASRGEILDRSGNVLATTTSSFNIELYKTKSDNDTLNKCILNLIELFEAYNVGYPNSFPINNEATEFTIDGENLRKWLENYKLDNSSTPQDVMNYFIKKYNINVDDIIKARKIMSIRYEILTKGYSSIKSLNLAKNVPREVVAQISEKNFEFPGVNITTQTERKYNYGNLASHIIGYIGKITKDEYEEEKELYNNDDYVGRTGIESSFEKYLRGKKGKKEIEMSVDGTITGETTTDEPTQGSTIVLTIDSKLQEIAERSLANNIEKIRNGGFSRSYNAQGGCVVAIDVRSGEIIAMASNPDFNPNSWVGGISVAEYNEIKEKNSWFNKSISGAYAPGSIFKMVTALAGLESGAISTTEKINDTGIYTKYRDYQPHCWIYDSNHHGHGYLNVSGAIQHSCNYFFYEVGDRIKIDTLDKYARYFGLGLKTKIELPSETAGTLASPEVAKRVNETWSSGRNLSAAIGQSYNAFSPLQIAKYIAMVANGGNKVNPTVIKRILNSDGTESLKSEIDEYCREKLGLEDDLTETLTFSQNNINSVLEGMRSVTDEGGTASSIFRGFNIEVGGKTGSAEAGKNVNAWFAGFAPYYDPEIAVVVMVENGGHGYYTAEVAKEIIAEYFGMNLNSNEIQENNQAISYMENIQ
ncbi:MAG: penicillin-binding protein 2 [Clostridia bacterium]|nr:penicillin-binding protein 2 [Clostridia bacterium]